MYENRLGLVSNCWRVQLDAGESLSSLIGQAVESGFRFVELRQGCLGECENSKTRMPDVDMLAGLLRRFPEVIFDLAVELPIFSRPISTTSNDVRTFLDAAMALADSRSQSSQVAASRLPHLRIVDLVSKSVPGVRAEYETRDADGIRESGFLLEDVVSSLQDLQAELAGGVLSIEHSYQSWSGFRRLFEVVNGESFESDDGELENQSLKLCYDPCNLWLTGDGDAANQITAAMPVDWLSMVHLKQRRDGITFTRLEAGDVDWSQQLRILNRAGYAGPFLFETTPAEDVWQCLADSRRHLMDLIQ